MTYVEIEIGDYTYVAHLLPDLKSKSLYDFAWLDKLPKFKRHFQRHDRTLSTAPAMKFASRDSYHYKFHNDANISLQGRHVRIVTM